MGATSFVNVTGIAPGLSAVPRCAAAEAASAAEVGACALGATVTIVTSVAAARTVRTLIPASKFYFSLLTLAIFSASKDL
jgi:hypothetical protein